MQWVMPTEARATRVVDGLVGNRLVWIAPEPLLPEKLRERPGMDAAQAAAATPSNATRISIREPMR